MSLLKMATNPKFNEIRLMAYEALLKYGVDSLPINFNYGENIKIFSMQLLAGCFHEDPREYIRLWKHNGIVLYSVEYDKYIIFFNADDPIDSIRWSLATALGYIEMGYSYRVFERGITLRRNVSSIDAFSFCYTCPDFLTDECEITTAEKIMVAGEASTHHPMITSASSTGAGDVNLLI